MTDTEKTLAIIKIVGHSVDFDDPKGALFLVEWMRKKGFGFHCRFHVTGGVSVEFYSSKTGDSFLVEQSPTFCQAVTDAFIKANGIEL